jgi:hypothetical protein
MGSSITLHAKTVLVGWRISPFPIRHTMKSTSWPYLKCVHEWSLDLDRARNASQTLSGPGALGLIGVRSSGMQLSVTLPTNKHSMSRTIIAADELIQLLLVMAILWTIPNILGVWHKSSPSLVILLTVINLLTQRRVYPATDVRFKGLLASISSCVCSKQRP